MKNDQQLINNIIGQLNGLKEMMAAERDCFEVLTQMKAAKSSFNTLMNRYLEAQFTECIGKCKDKESKKETCQKFFKELTCIN